MVGGGGFSGVETVGEVEHFARNLRRRYYHKVNAAEIRPYMVELGPRLLPEMPPEMGEYARRKLRGRGSVC